jgi:flagellar hook-associated protein 3 FlgL
VRITNGILQKQALESLQGSLRQMADANRQVVTGLRVSKPSDDPVATGSIMSANSGLRALEQYRRNLSTASSRMSVEDGVLDHLGNVLSRARELAVSQAGDTATAQTRDTVAREIDELREFARSLANTELAGVFVFGGNYADSEPYPASGPDPLRPPAGDQQVEIAEGRTVTTNHSAQEIFVDSGVMDALERFSVALKANDVDEIRASITDLTQSHGLVQDIVGELGARQANLDVTSSNLDALEVNLQTFRSDLQDAEIERAVTELVNRQSAYQAALAANARIFSTTITDYLR